MTRNQGIKEWETKIQSKRERGRVSHGMNTSDFDSATLETPLLDVEETRVVCHDNWDDGNSGLDREMKCSFFER